MDKKEDRRVQRTRGMLLESLLDLMIEKSYDDITIQDIIDRANVGRSTFYAHFTDKEQLLMASIGQLKLFLHEQIERQPSDESGDGPRWRYSLPLLQHIQSHKRIYKNMVKQPSGAVVLHYMQNMITELAKEQIERMQASFSRIPLPVMLSFVVNTFLTLLPWWMEQTKPIPAEEVDRLFHDLSLRGIGWAEAGTSS